jgi:Fe-S cluster assembly ATP-binding protein
MLKIENLKVALTEEKKEIIHGVSLEIKPGEVHLLNGNNGSGKSTLVNAIMGNPAFETISGQIKVIGETYSSFIIQQIDDESFEGTNNNLNDSTINLTNLEPNERSLLGIFLANQYPMEIPGVSLMSYLRLIYNSRRPKEEQLPVFKFRKLVEDRANIINYPKHLLKRNLNEGFSGGEKKKTEILQMLILEPRYVMLDEIDSGLDRNSVKEVFSGLSNFKQAYPKVSFIIITHYDRVQEYLKPDFVYEMVEGKLG